MNLENSHDQLIDTVLETGALFDWISPTICFIHDWQERPTVGFVVQHDEANEFMLHPLLRRRGYRSWGWFLLRHQGILYTSWRTRQAQAWLTHNLLTKQNVWHTCSEFRLLPYPHPVMLPKLSTP